MFNIWDCAGQEFYQGFDNEYTGCHGAIIMFDMTSRVSYSNVSKWYNQIRQTCPDIPIVLCGNKVDIKDLKIKPEEIQFHKDKNMCFLISAKSNFNFEKPFLFLARQMTHNPSLNFIERQAILPPEVLKNN
jgi:GTP-binding nuclear protein Ran